MKRNIITSLLLVIALCGSAATPLRLVFKATDGSTYSFDTKELNITVSNGALIVTNSEATATLPLAELTSMYFNGEESGIKSAALNYNDGEVEVFTLSGTSAGKFSSLTEAMSQLKAGIYVCGTYKFQVK